MKRVTEVPAGRTTEAWEKAFAAADIPHARMHPLTSLLDDPYLDEVGFFSRSHHPVEGAVRAMRAAARWSATQTAADAACTGARGTELPEEEIDRLLASQMVIGEPDQHDAARDLRP